ncbi:hypothetical protein MMC08_007417 [Hypocenomyce scalaris]|nr:hypothetical protein [Hypocenomyce scalaris]
MDRTALFAPLIQLVWQASDTSKTISTSSSASTTATTTSSLSSTASSSPANSAAPSSGLSTGAKIAIGVVVTAVFILAITAICASIYLRRRRRAHAYTAAPAFSDSLDQPGAEMHGLQLKPELNGKPSLRHELDTAGNMPELHSTPLTELDAATTGR